MEIKDIKIFIPTKNRPNKQKTYEILTSLDLKPVLVIEPQEEQAIKGKYEYILLPDNDRGISFSRNYILNYSRQNKFDYIVMIDDDVNSFYKKNEEGKLEKNNESFLEALERFIEYRGYCGLEYQQFAWCQDSKYTYNRSVEVCMMIYVPYIPDDVQFDPKSKEDKDFAIQMIMKGKKTMKMNDIALAVPSVGTNEGGLHDWYQSEGDKQASEYMLEKWGEDIITLKQKKDRVDAMVNWKNVSKINKIQNNEFALF